jgi:predicted ThiF/HesA family dinucleotide-utilizing enzyme
MKLAKASMTGLLVAAAFVACSDSPVEQTPTPYITLSADSVTVGVFDSSTITAAIFNIVGQTQYVSRDQSVATVSANGAIGAGDEYIPVYEAEELHAAAPQPKTIRWYDAGHSLTQQAGNDRYDWLVAQIGIDAR